MFFNQFLCLHGNIFYEYEFEKGTKFTKRPRRCFSKIFIIENTQRRKKSKKEVFFLYIFDSETNIKKILELQ